MIKDKTDIRERKKVLVNENIKPPPNFLVVFLNDNVTTMDFVIELLINFFNHSKESATELARLVHETGEGVAASLPFEIAEQKATESVALARKFGFPLNIRLDPEK